MSHFTTIVITKADQNPEELLNPFYEQVEAGEDYAEFNVEVTKEDFASRAKSIVKEASSDTKTKYQKLFKEKKYTEMFADWFGGEENEDGDWGYWNNPNAKWDWYLMGGRWTGYFKPKKGAKGKLGRSGVGDNKPKEGYVDQIAFKDIDFEGMKKDSKIRANELWEEAKGLKDDRREFEYGIKKGETKEHYVERHNSVAPHAIITSDGEWNEQGEMGWWGLVSNEKDHKTWEQIVEEILKNCEPDDTLTLFDLHI